MRTLVRSIARTRSGEDGGDAPNTPESWAPLLLRGLTAPGPHHAPGTQSAQTGELPVNTGTAGTQIGADIVALANSYVVRWTDEASGDIKIRFFENDGDPLGGEIIVNNTTALEQAGGNIARLADGGFVTTWTSGTGASADILAQRFDAAGAEVGPEFTVNTIVTNSQSGSTVTGLAGGGFVITWTHRPPTSNQDFDVKAQIYDASGVPVGGEFQVNPVSEFLQSSATVAGLPNGGFVAIYYDLRSPSGEDFNVWFQRFNAIGETVGARTQVNLNSPRENHAGADVAVFADGSFVVTWTETRGEGGGNGYRVFLRRFDADGVPSGDGQILVEEIVERNPRGTSVTALENGYYLVTYSGWVQAADPGPSPTNPQGRQPTMGRIYGPNDQPAGDAFEISNAGTAGAAAVLNDASNSVVVAYANNDVAAPFDIYMRRYWSGTPTDANPPIAGDGGPNTLTGTPTGDVLQGLGGNDIINGAGGPDRMEGGTGDDVMRIDNAADSPIELAGEGNDLIFSSVSYLLAPGVEIETMTTILDSATTAINLTGNGFGQSIYGNAGNNVLDGRGGNDLLVGYGGSDILVGGDGADVMRGGTGNDFYRVKDGLDLIIEAAGEGDDTLVASVSFQLADGLSIETMVMLNQAGTEAFDLIGNELAQSIFGNAGHNLLNGGGGDDQLVGYAGNDILVGAAGADVMRGNAGNDFYRVEDLLDSIFETAGEGNDTLLASTSYVLGAGISVETMAVLIQAGTEAIDLTGNELGNSINGNDGANRLDGKLGLDLLRGYGGADIFQFSTAHGAANLDFIADFVSGTDTIALDNAIFTALADGALPAGAFVIGTAAQDGDDRIIYNQATGQLFYDADGNGGAAPASLFATLIGAPALGAGDFTII